MTEIGALYHAVADAEALDDSEKVDSVYILTDTFVNGKDLISSISGLREYFGEPVYEGNSNAVFPEAVAINLLNDKKKIFQGKVKMDISQEFSDVAMVNSFDRQYPVYIYSFRRGDIIYSFVCGQEGEEFEFYYITGAEDESA